MPTLPYLEKVTAFITRRRAAWTELLLFRHPNAGIQFPAGTVEAGETPDAAALRETCEETGLRQVRVIATIGWRDELPPGVTHIIAQKTTVYSRPDPSSSAWAYLPRGLGVCLLRHDGDFAQVIYEESDRWPDPSYTTYHITGWVLENHLAGANRRHFFHLVCEQDTPDEWEVFSDNHLFRHFWTPLNRIPEIISPQRAWLDFVTQELHYHF